MDNVLTHPERCEPFRVGVLCTLPIDSSAL